MNNKNLVIVILILLSIIGCSKKPAIDISTSPQEEFSRAMDLLQAKKYRQAATAFQDVVFNFPGSSYAADAQFYLSETYFLKKDYHSAIPEFEFFINSFPGNQYLEDAYYKLALCYFRVAPSINRDPSIIEKASEILELLEERFPDTRYHDEIIQMRREIAERWAEKQYRIGELYYKGEEYSAARIYFNVVLDEYTTTKWAGMSKYMIGQILEKSDSTNQAIDIYQTLITGQNDPEVIQLAQKRITVLGLKKQ